MPEDNEDTNNDYAESGERNENSESVIETLYNTEKRILLLEKSMYGIAPMSFIQKQTTSLRAIINTTNAFTRRTAEECKEILYRSVEAFILDMVKENEEDLPRKHYRTLAKSYEHALELFLGLPEGGHGARVLNDALAGISQKPETGNNKTFKEWIQAKIDKN